MHIMDPKQTKLFMCIGCCGQHGFAVDTKHHTSTVGTCCLTIHMYIYIYTYYIHMYCLICINIYCICTYRSHPFCWYKYSYHYLTHEFLTLSSPVVTGLWQQPREVPLPNGQLLNPTRKKKDRRTKSYSKMLANYFPFYWGGAVTATVNQFKRYPTCCSILPMSLWVQFLFRACDRKVISPSYKLAYKPHIDIA